MEPISEQTSNSSSSFMIDITTFLLLTIGFSLIAFELTENSMYENFILMGVIPKIQTIKTIIGSLICAIAILINLMMKNRKIR